MSEQKERLLQAVEENGHRLTPARRAIIDAFVESEGHITADDLAVLVRRSAPHVGRMTVYRTLDLLCDMGLVRPVFLGTGAAHFVLMDGGSHHHLICIQCQRVIDFDSCQESALAQALGRQFGFEVQGHLLEVYGLCRECLQTAAQRAP